MYTSGPKRWSIWRCTGGKVTARRWTPRHFRRHRTSTPFKSWQTRGGAAKRGMPVTLHCVTDGLLFWRSMDKDLTQATDVAPRLHTNKRHGKARPSRRRASGKLPLAGAPCSLGLGGLINRRTMRC